MLAGSSCTQTTSALRVLVERGLHLGFGPGVELLEEDDADADVLALLALDAQVVADLAGADEEAARVCDVVVREDVLEARRGEVGDGGRRRRGGAACSSA